MDDGSKTLEDSVAMLRMAAEGGTRGIVATPHADLEYKFQPDLIRERADQLRAAAGGRIELWTGCDFHLTFDNIQDAINHPTRYTINHKSYLLVEFSDMLIFQNTADIFARLGEAGMIPVVTHPERNTLLQQRLPQLKHWVEQGAYLQVTAQSLTGRFGKTARAFSLELLNQNLVHFIASDAHDLKHRPPLLKEAFGFVSKEYSAELAQALFVDNPTAAVAGAPLPPQPYTFRPSRKWYQFWR